MESAQAHEDASARCLAFAGDIHYALWTDICASSAHKLHLVLLAAKKAAFRIAKLVVSLPEKPLANSYGYLGKYLWALSLIWMPIVQHHILF